jgi:hypothetical protein
LKSIAALEDTRIVTLIVNLQQHAKM